MGEPRAQDLQNRVQVGQRLLIEGRLRMNTVPRQDGTKEKRAEFTLARLHPVTGGAGSADQSQVAGSAPARRPEPASAPAATPAKEPAAQWNTAPLVPDTDDIPF